MIEELVRFFSGRPRNIDKVIWNDPILTLIGSDWTFNTMSLWRCFEGSQLIEGFGSKNANTIVSAFNGQKTTISVGENGIDPEFRFVKGMVLQILVTNWFEPWVHHDNDATLV